MFSQTSPEGSVDSQIIKPKPPIKTGAKILASPNHPSRTEDKAYYKDLLGGRSAIFGVMDGVGSGGERSALAAEIVQKRIMGIESQVNKPPQISTAVALLKGAIYTAAGEVKRLQRTENNDDIDTTVNVGMLCLSTDGNRRFIVTANVGDSRMYKFIPSEGKVVKVTVDDSLVQRFVEEGEITEAQAFDHPQRNIVTRTVGTLRTDKEITFTVSEVKDGDIFLAVSDGVSDNLTPTGLPVAVIDSFRQSFDRAKRETNIPRMASLIAERSRNIQVRTKAAHAKPDDTTVVILQVPPITT